jgi:two-component system phosphate regulon response regulator PhoB
MSADGMFAGATGRRVTLAGREFVLTPSESRLLEVLRSQPGRAFSRTELVARVMAGTIVLERTIDVHVKTLRQKLGDLAGMIETVRRVGYRFAPAGGGREPVPTERQPATSVARERAEDGRECTR